ncbi:PilZ domain-containing protein [Candidatus Omnitrophota bacterium]
MINDLNSKLMNDLRRNPRVKNRSRISWHIKDSELMGQGRVLNLSSTGMLLESNSALEPTINSFLSLNSLSGKNNYFPQFGRIVWHKRINTFKDKILFGVEFVNPSKEILVRLTNKINRGMTNARLFMRMGSVTEALVVMAIIALTGYIMWLSTSIYTDLSQSSNNMLVVSSQQATLTQNFSSLYQSSQSQLSSVSGELTLVNNELTATNQMLETVNAELESTKSVLAQTETMLAQARTDMKAMQVLNQQRIEAVKSELNASIVSLQEESLQLTTEMQHLMHKLDYYEGNVNSLDEGIALMGHYREKMNVVKSRIRGFRQEAALARTAAQKEQDRIKMVLGNNGYFMRDGRQVTVDTEKYNAVSLDGVSAQQGNIAIDVNFLD